MCEGWEFGCGHISETRCQAYKNRILKEINKGKESEDPAHEEEGLSSGKSKGKESSVDDDDDPFTDAAGALPKAAKSDVVRAHSDSNPDRPPKFTLPSSTPSSVTNDSDVQSPTATSTPRGINSATSESVVRTVRKNKNKAGLITSRSLGSPTDNIIVCPGPGQRRKKIQTPCYDCILEQAKSNSTFQADERAAETRLYEEVGGQTGSSGVGVADPSGGSATDTGKSTDEYPGDPARLPRGKPPGFVDSSSGHAAPPTGPRRRGGPSAHSFNTGNRGRYHRNQASAPTRDHFQAPPFATNAHQSPAFFYNPNDVYQGPPAGHAHSFYNTNPNPNGMNVAYQQHHAGGPGPATYQPQPYSDVAQYNQQQGQQQQQTTPYLVPMEPYGTPAQTPYAGQAYLYPQMEMGVGMDIGAGYQYPGAVGGGGGGGVGTEGNGGVYVDGFPGYLPQMGQDQGQGQYGQGQYGAGAWFGGA